MANPRSEIPIVVLSEESPTSPVAGATAFVKNRSTEVLTTVFSDSGTTNNAISQPLSTDSAGRLTGWLPRGAYAVEISVAGKTPYTEFLDIAPSSDGGVDTAWLASESVTGAKVAPAIKDAAAGTASLRTLGSGATQATAGNDSRLSNERTPTNNSVTSSKLAEGSVTATKLGESAVENNKIKDGAVTSRKIQLTTLGKNSTANTNLLSSSGGIEITGTSQTFTLATKSVLVVEATYCVYILIPSTGREDFRGKIFVDGVEQGKVAKLRYEWPGGGNSFGVEINVCQTSLIELAAGEHTVVMKGEIVGVSAVGTTYRTVSPYTGWQALVFSV